ncbi:MAG: prolyl oligopeptidase family serine peptidase [Flavobacteriaceae bacterium]
MKFKLTLLCLVLSMSAIAQKKVLNHTDYDLWNTVKNKTISNNGSFIMYSLERGEKDNFLKIKNPQGTSIFHYDRAEKGRFTTNSNYATFTIKPWKDSITELKRAKVKKDKLPKDTLGIYSLKQNKLTKIANVKSYKTPEKWEGYLAYLLDDVKASPKKKEASKDSVKTVKLKKSKKAKKVSAKNGYHLVLRNLETEKQDTLKFVTNYLFAKEGKVLAYTTTGLDSTVKAGVYIYDLAKGEKQNVYTHKKAKYGQLNLSDSGKYLGFIVDTDSTKVQIRPNEFYTWKQGDANAALVLNNTTAPQGYIVSPNGKISFSKDETKVYFGLATPPIIKDTTLLKEEISSVEVWKYDEPRLYTVQELQVKNDRKKSYTTVIHLKDKKLTQIATTQYPNAIIGAEGNADQALVSTSLPYQLESQWKGYTAYDYALVDLKTGETKRVLTNLAARAQLSPEGNYAYGYNSVDSTWFTYDLAKDKLNNFTKGKVFYNELNDSPKHPGSYRAAGWTKNDASFVVYDRYDLWAFSPSSEKLERLTQGRDSQTVYRFIRLDREEKYIASKKWLLSSFDENSKDSGYNLYDTKSGKTKTLVSGPYAYSSPMKAKDSDALIFTRESFVEFPDVRYADLSFKNQTQISHANPQQKDYNWGTAELVNWNSLDGIELTGMLIKPENFDPNKKYPMIVNFYERSSDRLHRHIAPKAERSTINYSFYTSRGYVIFNPDVVYRVGYPGESAINSVLPGVTSLIEKGFVDKDHIGVQGHSWGGYQIAYLVTQTDMFAAAESGAPVVNMISAYGGIRWWTGLSRQFQYEHTQSRIGGTPWEYPLRYIENSPIFYMDKVNTPLLIMHNDADGHVPWYQGIEYFTALRRLGKPSWFLNYNDEPHWPLKTQNRKDFSIRMQQFFDYYLKETNKPKWMESGVPAIQKGIQQNLELLD